MRVYFIELHDDERTSGYCKKEEAPNMLKQILDQLNPEEKITITATAKEISKQELQALYKDAAA